MAKSKLVKANEKIAEKVVGGYRKIEQRAVGGYKKIEQEAVGGFNKMADKFVDNYLTKEGESVEEARERLATEQRAREKKGKKQQVIVEENMRSTQNATAEVRRKAGLKS